MRNRYFTAITVDYFFFFFFAMDLREPESTSARSRPMTAGIFIGIADEKRRYTISRLPTSSIPSNPAFRPSGLCSLAPIRSTRSRGGIRAEPAGPLFLLAEAIDTWRATGVAVPREPSVTPLARSIYRSRGITCEPCCVRDRVSACMRVACLRSRHEDARRHSDS